ncbi:phage terminase small subunit [Streptomyces pseudogriseolus]|uniref:phage terminase small subunit n=1 Tax=Streptomyces pseudogriseolus TaxID=36817 RepID=UPI003FA34785
MAGRGPQPKDPSRRARANKDPVPQTVLRFEQAEPPELPTLQMKVDGEVVEMPWPERTVAWWEMWKASPQAEHFSSTDWDFLLDTALVHARFWSGDLSAAGELRLRVAKFGATPEDRARLRMQFAQADEADSKRPAGSSSKKRYADLKVLPGGGDAVAGS